MEKVIPYETFVKLLKQHGFKPLKADCMDVYKYFIETIDDEMRETMKHAILTADNANRSTLTKPDLDKLLGVLRK